MKSFKVILQISGLTLFMYSTGYAQCKVSIPSTAVTGGGTIGGGAERWACSGDSLFSNNSGTIHAFLESGAYFQCVDGGSHIIYVKSGATLDISGNGGSINVYQESGSIINNTLINSNNTFTKCTNIVFDYTTATTTSPCFFATTAGELSGAESMSLFPNPAITEISIRSYERQERSVFVILDVFGRVVGNGVLSGRTTTIPLDQFSSGIYVLKVRGAGMKTFTVIKD